MIIQNLDKNWRLRCQGEPDQPAVVPGTVYTDLLRNGSMEDPFWKDNEIREIGRASCRERVSSPV